MDPNEKILSRDEKIISSNQNEQVIVRITKSIREGATYQMTSEIKKKRIKKEMLPQVIERMKWKKFGKAAGQERGVLEPGIVEVNTDEIHIIDRKRDIEKDLGDKLRDKINDKKSKLLKEIKEKKEKENREKVAAYANSISKQGERQYKKRNNACTIRVHGFNPNYNAEQLGKLFSQAGEINRVVMPSKNLAYIRFTQTIFKQNAYDMFNDVSKDGCVIRVQLLEDN